MSAAPVRVSPRWLALREPADAAARDGHLAGAAAARLPRPGAPAVIHDLGCGTGSMGRWLAPRLPGAQHWILTDRDADLLTLAATGLPAAGAGGAPVTVEIRQADLTTLPAAELAGAGLVTASALLDLFTAAELGRLVGACVGAGCPALLTLSVTGRVALAPADPLDAPLAAAFNEHQRRVAAGGRLLGPDAVVTAVALFTRAGWRVRVRPSPWRLAGARSSLAVAWLDGWVAAARERRPDLAAAAGDYTGRRLAQAAAGELRVTVYHQDLLAWPTDAPAGR